MTEKPNESLQEKLQETPDDDPRERSDWKAYPGSKEPWKQNAQKTQDPSAPDTAKPDLEKWNDTDTH